MVKNFSCPWRNSVKLCRMSSTTSGRSMDSTDNAARPPANGFRLILPRAPRRSTSQSAFGSNSEAATPCRSVAKEKTFGTNIAEHFAARKSRSLLKRSVEPRPLRAARGRLGLADDHRQIRLTKIETPRRRTADTTPARLIRPLIDDCEPVVRGLHGIQQSSETYAHGCDRCWASDPSSPRNQAMQFSFRPEPIHRFARERNNFARPARKSPRLGATVRAGRTISGLEPEQRLKRNHEFHHHIAGLTRRYLHTGNVTPTRRLELTAERSARRLVMHVGSTGGWCGQRFSTASRITCSTVLDSLKLMIQGSTRLMP